MGLGLGLGGRGGNPKLRALRMVLMLALLVAAVVFHGHGGAYREVRFVYLAAVVVLLLTRFRSRRPRSGTGPGSPMGPGSRLGPSGPGQRRAGQRGDRPAAR